MRSRARSWASRGDSSSLDSGTVPGLAHVALVRVFALEVLLVSILKRRFDVRFVIPAYAGIHVQKPKWIPAFAGMTSFRMETSE
ncbi:hypothetical protein BH11GEM2_BH11GEM2_07410 [soil metagenome]